MLTEKEEADLKGLLTDYQGEGFTADVLYLQGVNLKELRTKVLKSLDKGYEPEGTPFLDHLTEDGKELWTQMMIQTSYEDEEGEK